MHEFIRRLRRKIMRSASIARPHCCRDTRNAIVLAASVAVGIVSYGALSPARAQGSPETARKAAEPSRVEQNSGTASGMRIYIDPQTGQLLNEPAPGTVPLPLSPQEQDSLSTSHDGLVETPVPGGGFRLDLQGRFQSPLIATVDQDGKVKIQHPSEQSHSQHK